MKKPKFYYHVIEQLHDNFAHVNYYNTEEEAKKEAKRRQEYFPNSFFYIEASTSIKEPNCITV